MITPLKDIIKKLVEEDLGITRIRDEMSAEKAWKTLELKGVSENTSFDKLLDGVLFLHVKNPAWAQRINLMSAEIIAKLNERAGQRLVSDIRTRTGSVGESSAEQAQKKEQVCARCGVGHYGGAEICPACDRETKLERTTMIWRLVDGNPKLSLDEARAAVPDMSTDDFRKIKRNMNSMKSDLMYRKGLQSGKENAAN